MIVASPFVLYEWLLQDWHRLRMKLIEEEGDCPECLADLDREFRERLAEYRKAERENK